MVRNFAKGDRVCVKPDATIDELDDGAVYTVAEYLPAFNGVYIEEIPAVCYSVECFDFVDAPDDAPEPASVVDDDEDDDDIDEDDEEYDDEHPLRRIELIAAMLLERKSALLVQAGRDLMTCVKELLDAGD